VSRLRQSRLFPALAPIVLLAACGDSPGDEAGTASGEVLEGTISDSMLPLDAVRSQPPLAQPSAARTGASASASETPEGEGTEAAGEDSGAAQAGDATAAAAAD
jgi:hypothetical protein